MTATHAPRRAARTAAKRRAFLSDALVPPPSPAWYGSVMGSAILGTLSQLRRDILPFAHEAAVFFWSVSVLLLVGLTAGFVARVIRDRDAFRASIATPVAMSQWGMVSMGVLAVGAATAAVLPTMSLSATKLAWQLDLGLWIIGTIIGVLTALGVSVRLLVTDPGTPTTVWGLAVVPPMVSATVGGGLVGWVDGTSAKVWLLMASVACFFLALVLGAVVFGIAYRHHWLVEPLPLAASITAWLPLGIVGQSTAAAQTIARQASGMLLPATRPAVHEIADGYSIAMLALGLPLAVWALAMTVRGFRKAMPFSPGWWGMTFPVGTLVLGSTLLGTATHEAFFTEVGGVLYVFLLCTWTTAAVFSIAALGRRAVAA